MLPVDENKSAMRWGLRARLKCDVHGLVISSSSQPPLQKHRCLPQPATSCTQSQSRMAGGTALTLRDICNDIGRHEHRIFAGFDVTATLALSVAQCVDMQHVPAACLLMIQQSQIIEHNVHGCCCCCCSCRNEVNATNRTVAIARALLDARIDCMTAPNAGCLIGQPASGGGTACACRRLAAALWPCAPSPAPPLPRPPEDTLRIIDVLLERSQDASHQEMRNTRAEAQGQCYFWCCMLGCGCRAALHCCMHEKVHGSSIATMPPAQAAAVVGMAAQRMLGMQHVKQLLSQPQCGRTSGAISKWKRPSSDASTVV
jgi:hypothetical protein